MRIFPGRRELDLITQLQKAELRLLPLDKNQANVSDSTRKILLLTVVLGRETSLMGSVHFVVPEKKLRKYPYSIRLCSVTSHLKSEMPQDWVICIGYGRSHMNHLQSSMEVKHAEFTYFNVLWKKH